MMSFRAKRCVSMRSLTLAIPLTVLLAGSVGSTAGAEPLSKKSDCETLLAARHTDQGARRGLKKLLLTAQREGFTELAKELEKNIAEVQSQIAQIRSEIIALKCF